LNFEQAISLEAAFMNKLVLGARQPFLPSGHISLSLWLWLQSRGPCGTKASRPM